MARKHRSWTSIDSYKGTLVVQNQETSSPGMAFLLATIAGTPDWEEFWAQLRSNDVAVTSGWEAAYGDFIAGGGDRPRGVLCI